MAYTLVTMTGRIVPTGTPEKVTVVPSIIFTFTAPAPPIYKALAGEVGKSAPSLGVTAIAPPAATKGENPKSVALFDTYGEAIFFMF